MRHLGQMDMAEAGIFQLARRLSRRAFENLRLGSGIFPLLGEGHPALEAA